MRASLCSAASLSRSRGRRSSPRSHMSILEDVLGCSMALIACKTQGHITVSNMHVFLRIQAEESFDDDLAGTESHSASPSWRRNSHLWIIRAER